MSADKEKFNKITHGKVGDIIYPAYNGTCGFLKKPRWDVVMRVNKDGMILDRSCLWDYSSVRAIEVMQILCGFKDGPRARGASIKAKKTC